MNTSGGIFVDEYWQQFEPVKPFWHYIKVVYMSCMFVFGLPANISVIVYYVKNSRIENRKSYSYLLINLMVADLIHLLCLPLVMYNAAYGEWKLGQAMCDLYAICASYFGFVSIITMTMISIERYLVIKYPFKVLDSNKKMSVVLIVSSWLYATVWVLLPLLTPHGYVPEGFLTSCTVDYISQDKASHAVMLLMVVFGFVVPATTTAVFYSLIFAHVKSYYSDLKVKYNIDASITRASTTATKTTRNKSNATPSAVPFNNKINTQTIVLQTGHNIEMSKFEANTLQTENSDSNTGSSKAKKKQYLKNMDPSLEDSMKSRKCDKPETKVSTELRLMRSSLLIVIIFCMVWSPYAILTLIAKYSPKRAYYITPNTAILPTLFAKSSVALNPIIYAFTNKSLLQGIKKRCIRLIRKC